MMVRTLHRVELNEAVVSSNPGGEEGEELRAALAYRGEGKGYHDRKGYKPGEYAKPGNWTTNTEGPGYRFSGSKTRKIIAKNKRAKAKEISRPVTGMGDAEGASTEDLAKRAIKHGRETEGYGGLTKGTKEYHDAAVESARKGTLKPSITANMGDGTNAMIGGRTSARHHQLAGKPVKATEISAGDVLKAADSARRHDKFVSSGGYEKRKTELEDQGKIMREEFKRTLHRVELNESNNDQRDDSAPSTVADDILRKKLRGGRDLSKIKDTRRNTYGQNFPAGRGGVPLPPQTPKEKIDALYRQSRVQRRDNFKGAIQQGKSAISRKFKKGWKGATLPAEQAVQDTAKWPNPGGSTHIISRGQKKVKGAKPLKGEVHGEEMDMARPVGEGGEVTRNLVARKMEKPREGGTQVVPKTPPFQPHDDNIRSMARLGKEYAGTPSKKDRPHPPKKPIQRQSQKIER